MEEQPIEQPKPDNLKKKTLWTVIIGVGVILILLIAYAIWYQATLGLEQTLRKQQEYLRNGDYVNAYSLNSTDFKKAVSMDQFKTFMQRYPVLVSGNLVITQRKIATKSGSLIIDLVEQNKVVNTAEYRFIKENEEWKILAINIPLINNGQEPLLSEIDSLLNVSIPENEQDKSQVKITEIKLNDKADLRGVVTEMKNIFSADTPEIFISIFVEKAYPGLSVSASLIYLTTGDKVGPVTNETKGSNDIISNFSFSKPTIGWPKGEYLIAISLSDGQKSEINFSIQ